LAIVGRSFNGQFALPAARLIAGDQLVLILDVGGVIEIRHFDAKTPKPLKFKRTLA
jgi:hypothetical protein